MRISDWSSDVCSSDLLLAAAGWPNGKSVMLLVGHQPALGQAIALLLGMQKDRKSVVEGKSVSVRVDTGGRRIIRQKKKTDNHSNTSRNTQELRLIMNIHYSTHKLSSQYCTTIQ